MAKTVEAATVDSVMAWIQKTGSAKVRNGMARYGLPTANAVGIPVGAMRAQAKRIGPSHALALGLWKTGNYEAQLMAAMLGEPDRLTPAQMDAWCRDFDNWGTVDTACFTLFDRSPLGWKMAPKWSKEKGEFQKRAGFVMMACLAAHDKTAKDSAFLKFFPIIEDWKSKGWVAEDMVCSIHRAHARLLWEKDRDEAWKSVEMCMSTAREAARSAEKSWQVSDCLEDASFLTHAKVVPIFSYAPIASLYRNLRHRIVVEMIVWAQYCRLPIEFLCLRVLGCRHLVMPRTC